MITVPVTGDRTAVWLLIALIAVSLAAIAAIVILRVRRGKGGSGPENGADSEKKDR